MWEVLAAGRPFPSTLRRTAVSAASGPVLRVQRRGRRRRRPEHAGKGSADAVTVVRWIAPGTYQLDVQNTSGIGYINQFTWVPPGT